MIWIWACQDFRICMYHIGKDNKQILSYKKSSLVIWRYKRNYIVLYICCLLSHRKILYIYTIQWGYKNKIRKYCSADFFLGHIYKYCLFGNGFACHIDTLIGKRVTNFCNSVSAFLYTKPFLSRGLIKGKNLLQWEQILSI